MYAHSNQDQAGFHGALLLVSCENGDLGPHFNMKMWTPSPHFHKIGLGLGARTRVRDKARDMDRVRTSFNSTKGSLISWGSPKFYDTG